MSGLIGPPGFAGEWSGGIANPFAECVLAPNPGPATLDGTNTWIVGDPDGAGVTVIDPGPDDWAHWDAVSTRVAERGARIERILLTHGHLDHSAGARMFAAEAGCDVLALDPRHQLGGEGLVAGRVLQCSGVEVHVVATAGHTSDSLSFYLPQASSLLTGDTVLGRGTTVVAHPDGVLADYLDSLQRIRQLISDTELSIILPGHGPTLADPATVIDYYLAHRQERLDQVRQVVAEVSAEATAAGDPTSDVATDVSTDDLAQRIVEVVYADVPRTVWPLALLSVRAQLEYLRTR